MIKKTILVTILSLAVVLGTGCDSSSPQSNYNNYTPANNYSSTYNNGQTSSQTSTNSSTITSSSNSVSQVPHDYNSFWAQYYLGVLDWSALRDEVNETKGFTAGTYEKLARSTNGLFGANILIAGQIYQVLENSKYYEGLINITYHKDQYFEYFDDPIYYIVPKEFVSKRILEGDLVTIWGRSAGLYTYQSTLGTQVTVPCIAITKFEFR